MVDISAGMSQEIWAEKLKRVRSGGEDDSPARPDGFPGDPPSPPAAWHHLSGSRRCRALAYKSSLWPCCVWKVKRRTPLASCICPRGNIKQTLNQLYLRCLSHSFSGVSWAFQHSSWCLSQGTREPQNSSTYTWVTALWIRSQYSELNTL